MYRMRYGDVHCGSVFRSAKCSDMTGFVAKFAHSSKLIECLQEIQKSRLSKGEKQVFIFSTNEEIIGENYKVISKDIKAKFTLENLDITRTLVTPNKYFGE